MTRKRTAETVKPEPRPVNAESPANPQAAKQERKIADSIIYYAAFLLIAAVAAYLRVINIESRPLHSDESVNFLFIENLFRDKTYAYSHENYHGPLYFFAMGLGIWLFGDDVLGVRAASIFFGVLALVPLLCLRRFCGSRYVLIAAAMLAISPSFIFHSRYAIHEMLLVTASVWFGVSAFLLWVTFRTSFAVTMMVAASLMICTKETWIVTAAAVAVGLLLSGRPFERLRKVLERRQALFGGFVLFVLIILLCFSNGLQSGQGLHEFFLAIPQWIGRGHKDHGHFKPWNYYVQKLIWTAEPYLLIGFAVSLIVDGLFALFPRFNEQSEFTPIRSAFYRFLFGWAAVVILVYSYIPYKTPWLIINLTLPLILIFSWTVSQLIGATRIGFRLLGFACCLAGVFLSLRSTATFCYDSPQIASDQLLAVKKHIPYGEGNPYSYVHTSPTMLNLVNDVFEYWKTHPEAKVLIGVDGYFPLPYYLRRRAPLLAYLKTKDPAAWKKQYDVIIVEHTVQYADPDFEKRYYRLSDYGESNTYFKK